MGKKNIKPQQQQPVIRNTTAKAFSGLTEENLTQGFFKRTGEAESGAAIPGAGVIPAFCDLDMWLRF